MMSSTLSTSSNEIKSTNQDGKCSTVNQKVYVFFLGDGLVGKSSIALSYINNEFTDGYDIFDISGTELDQVSNIDGEDYSLIIGHIYGTKEYYRLRSLNYPRVDCFIICYKINSDSSYTNVLDVHMPEIEPFRQERNIPIILVATQSDLRDKNSREKLITFAEGETLKDKIKAHSFVECSSKSMKNVSLVFEQAIKAVKHSRTTGKQANAKKRSCNIL